MKSKLILASLLTALSACSTTTTEQVKTTIPTEIDGLKVYDYNDIKECGFKDHEGKFQQLCDKKTGELLTGVKYSRYDDKDDVEEYISYYKDGWEVKHYTKKNGITTSECYHHQDVKKNLFTYTSKNYFDNGKLQCTNSGKRELKNHERIETESTCYYITGTKSSKSTMNRKDGYVSIDYAPDGKFIIKGTKPYEKNEKSSDNTGIEENMIDKYLRYDENGKLYTGKVTYYFDEEPETIALIASLKNGKRDGESYSFRSKKDIKKYGDDIKEFINVYKDGTKVKSKTIYKDENKESSETHFVGDNEIYISHNKEGKESGYVACRYKGNNTRITITGSAALGFVKMFEKDQTKSLCPDISALVK